MSKKLLNNKRAFSLIEVLMAIALFTFLVVGVLTMTTMGIRTNSYAQHHTKAVQLAESSMEMLRRVDYNNVLRYFDGISHSVITPNGVTIFPVSEYGSIPQYMDFRRVLLVTYNPNVSSLRVTITWRSQDVDSFPLVLTSQRVAP
ncbi:MAG: prepilin-type N-terminal cleavage/methylation domain-containing protein [Candidatus Aminicenantes bacterium]|nr:prepilin-type N-terminal cleavage/methylation domain-containing protein [Candidatus Aminicenantes bacterium]